MSHTSSQLAHDNRFELSRIINNRGELIWQIEDTVTGAILVEFNVSKVWLYSVQDHVLDFLMEQRKAADIYEEQNAT